jgi:hypothetical protein
MRATTQASMAVEYYLRLGGKRRSVTGREMAVAHKKTR